MLDVRERLNFAIMGRSLWALSRGLCSGPRAQARLFVVYVSLLLVALRNGSRQESPARLRIQVGTEERDWWVADAMEVAALWEVFIAEQYGDWLPSEPHLVIDAGANVGTATVWFRHRFPAARVIAVEPNPDAVDRLRRNVGADPNVEIVHAALTGADGTIQFAAEGMTILGHVVDDASTPGVEVEAMTLTTLRARYAPDAEVDVLKIDTEGSEWPVLAGSLSGIGTIVMEVHDPVPGDRDPDEVLEDVAKREGFTLRRGYSHTMASFSNPLRWLLPDPDSARPSAERESIISR